MRIRTTAGFSLIEMLVVIGVIAILAALVAGLFSRGSGQSSLKTAEAQLEQIDLAIESYQNEKGQFPPTNVAGGTTNDIAPLLFYELTGTVFDPANSEYTDILGNKLKVGQVNKAFGVGGFLNSGPGLQDARNYLKGLNIERQTRVVDVNGELVRLLTLEDDWPSTMTNAPLPSANGVNPWRYQSVGMTNNTETYDLSGAVVIRNERKLIANWKQ